MYHWLSSQQCSYPREEFAEVKWLYQVIVGAEIQAFDPILCRTASGQHQNRRLDTVFAQFTANRPAVGAGKPYIQDYQVVDVRKCLFHRRRTVGICIDGIRLVAQPLCDLAGNVFLVFH